MPACISIILPAYNAEKTIVKTVRSVQSQTFKDWKLIVVDDGSTDSTANVVKAISTKDSRIEYVYKPNGGVSSARNRGIEAADSKYIGFLDADDTIEPAHLEQMVSALEETDADLAMCGYCEVTQNNRVKICPPPYGLDSNIVSEFQTTTEQRSAGTKYLLTDSINILRLNILGVGCGIPNSTTKIYRLDIIRANGIRFEEGRHYAEDWKFNIDLLTSRDYKAVIVNSTLYNYYIETPGSLSKTPIRKRIDKNHRATKLKLDINDRYALGYESKVYSGVLMTMISYAVDLSRTCSKEEMLKDLQAYMSGIYIKKALPMLWQSDLPFHFKILANMLRFGKVGILTFRAIYRLKKSIAVR